MGGYRSFEESDYLELSQKRKKRNSINLLNSLSDRSQHGMTCDDYNIHKSSNQFILRIIKNRHLIIREKEKLEILKSVH